MYMGRISKIVIDLWQVVFKNEAVQQCSLINIVLYLCGPNDYYKHVIMFNILVTLACSAFSIIIQNVNTVCSLCPFFVI